MLQAVGPGFADSLCCVSLYTPTVFGHGVTRPQICNKRCCRAITALSKPSLSLISLSDAVQRDTEQTWEGAVSPVPLYVLEV